MNKSELISFHKAILWEEAKGKLRAIYMVNGQTNSESKHNIEWFKVKERVEEFIKAFEEDELQT